jgi:thymidylate synthase
MNRFWDIDQVQRWALANLQEEGNEVAPRGLNTRELLAQTFTIENPRARCLSDAARGWSLPAAIGELAWHLAASDDLQFISYYIPRWSELSDSSHIAGSCYGKRIFDRTGTHASQWQRLVGLLRSDRNSRRAILRCPTSNCCSTLRRKTVPVRPHCSSLCAISVYTQSFTCAATM